MIQLQIRRPREVTLGRTQSYRMGILALPIPGGDNAVFVCSRDANGIHDFERVATPDDIRSVSTDTGGWTYRTSTLDLWVASEGLANDMLEHIVSDIQDLLKSHEAPSGTIQLSGASV